MSPKPTKPAAKSPRQNKVYKKVPYVTFNIRTTFNNTLITVTDSCGNALFATSAGANNFRGSKKATTYAATSVMQKAIEKLPLYESRMVDIKFKGPGSQKDAMLKTALNSIYKVETVVDTTPVPHNGVRPPKRRRI